MSQLIKQNISVLWQDTKFAWKDDVALQYEKNCVNIVEDLIDKFTSLNAELEYRVDQVIRDIEKYETL